MKEQFKVPAFEVNHRLGRVQKTLQENNIDALLVVQRVDLLYFSGTAQNGFLFIPREGDPLLFVRKYAPRARRESSIRHQFEIPSVKKIPNRIRDFFGKLPRTLGFELDVMPAKEFRFYRGLFPKQRCVDASTLIHKTRMIKSAWEIEQMEKTAERSRQTFAYLKGTIRAGEGHTAFMGRVETFARKIGHGARLRIRHDQTLSPPADPMASPPDMGLGPFARYPGMEKQKRFAPHVPIVINFPFVFNGFHLDETRMLSIGSMPQRALDACRAMIEIHNKVLDKVKPGVRIQELARLSAAKAKSSGTKATDLGPSGSGGAIGHGIGLELIERPILSFRSDEVFQSGMTLALKPHVAVENNSSVGIGSVFLVTESGYRLISRIPAQVFICTPPILNP